MQKKPLGRALSGEFLPVILVTQEHVATLRYLREHLPVLRPEKSFVLSITGPNGPLILVNVHDQAQLTAAVELLKQQGHINLKQPLRNLTPDPLSKKEGAPILLLIK